MAPAGHFVAAALYLVAVYHLTNLYFAKQAAFEASSSWPVATLGLFCAALLAGWWPARCCPCCCCGCRKPGLLAAAACALVLLGAFALLFVFIIGGRPSR